MKNLWLLLLLFCSIAVSAQNKISGKITDGNDAPLEYINVLLFNKLNSSFVKGRVSDGDGQFEFLNVEAGSYYLSATMIGFQAFESASFSIGATHKSKVFAISLSENAQDLEEVMVIAKKPLFEQQIDRTVINVQNSITANGSTALEILARSPGVQIDRLNNQIALQGKQGVVIMLNGKRMRMEMEGLVQLLQNMPSDNIQKIELITSPPASFDADGNAGIIHITTIKKEDDGINGNATLNGTYGLRPKYGSSLHLNIRKKGIHLFSDLSANHDYSQHTNIIHRKNTFENHITAVDVKSDRPAFTQFYTGRLGLDIYASDRTVIGLLFSGHYRHWLMDANTQTNIVDNINGLFINNLNVREVNEWKHWMANINFRHTFSKESQVSFDFDYLDYYDRNPVDYQELNLDDAGMALNQREFASTKETPIDFKVVKLDYSKKWSDVFSLQTGIKGSVSTFSNDLSLSQQENGQRIYDPRFTDVGYLDEKIAALYVSSDYIFNGKWTSKAGLRYEYYDSRLHSDQEGLLVDRRFGRLFPSLFLTYQANEHQQFQFSYSERINRPSFNELAPFFLFFGYNTVFTGNPQVQPTISKQVSASYRYKNVLFNLEFSDRDNPLTYQPEIIAEENLFIINAENMRDAKSAMFSVNVPWQVFDWWESRYNLSAYWIQLQPVYEGKIITERDVYFNANLAQNFSLPKDFDLELTANINSPRSWGLGRSSINGTINIGIQKSLSPTTKISFNWNDLFNMGSKWIFDFDQPELNLEYSWQYKMEGNLLRLGFSWQFGNANLKKASERKTGSEEERQRVN